MTEELTKQTLIYAVLFVIVIAILLFFAITYIADFDVKLLMNG